jgi:hypothetical protein
MRSPATSRCSESMSDTALCRTVIRRRTLSSSSSDSTSNKKPPQMRKIVLTTDDDPQGVPMTALLESDQNRMMSLLDELADDPHADWNAKMEELAAGERSCVRGFSSVVRAVLDTQHELVQAEINEIKSSPEYQEYELVSEATFDRITDEWCDEPAPVTANTIAELHRRIRVADQEMRVHYRDARWKRLEAEETAAAIAAARKAGVAVPHEQRTSPELHVPPETANIAPPPVPPFGESRVLICVSHLVRQ